MANNNLLASDNFASGSLNPAWIAAFGNLKCQVVSHQAEPSTLSTVAGQFWQGGVFPVDQSSEITLGTGWTNEASTIVTINVRASGITSGTKTCYEVDISNNSVLLFVTTNGTAVQQGSTITGLTIAAGDVWVLQAAGSIISLYQNNNFVAYFPDASIKAGAPGFQCYSTSNLAHATVASWRGYNAFQQDGIWQKQGIVMAPNTTDLLTIGAQNPTILLDTNPQILPGTQVYKMWFNAGTNNIGYAESTDGLNWTRRVTDVIVAGKAIDPAILKVAGTYHLYTIDFSVSPSHVYHCTSADGITWGAQTSVLVGGTAAWDTYLIFFTPIYVDGGGTWHAIYTGSAANTGDDAFNTGYATSPDGITWTKYAGNPVVDNFFGLQQLFLVGSTWYGWGAISSPGRGSAEPFDVPGEGVRMQTTDFINWTNPVKSLHCSQMFEGVNDLTGGCFPVSQVLQVNGKTYLYTTTSADDVTGSHNQVGIAIAPVPVSSVVQFPEDALGVVATDNFTSGIGDLDSNWVTPSSLTKLQIVAGNLVEASAASTLCVMCYTGASFSNDQYSSVTIHTLAAASDAIPTVRTQTAGQNYYFVQVDGPTGSLVSNVEIFKSVAGSNTQIGPTTQTTWEVGDVVTFVASGSSPVLLSLYQNGFLILQVEDWSNAFTSGFPGMLQFTATVANSQISGWAGGNANVIPIYPSVVGNGSLMLMGTGT